MGEIRVHSRYIGSTSNNGVFLKYAKSDDTLILYCKWGSMLYSCEAKDFETGARAIIRYFDNLSWGYASKVPLGTEIRMASCVPTKIKEFNLISSYGDVIYTFSQADNLMFDKSDYVSRRKAEMALSSCKKNSFVLDKLTEPCIAETEVDGFMFIID